jgi:apolipoprotein N-acyltransferase
MAAALGMLPKSPVDAAYAGPFFPGGPPTVFLLPDHDKRYRMGCSICFEIAFSGLHRRLMASDPDAPPHFFVACANESAFPGPLYARLSFDAQRLRAVECRRAFARIAQNGISAFIDGNGQVLGAEWTAEDSDTYTFSIPIDQRRSLYVTLGDWLPIVSCFVLAVLSCRRTPVRESPLAGA